MKLFTWLISKLGTAGSTSGWLPLWPSCLLSLSLFHFLLCQTVRQMEQWLVSQFSFMGCNKVLIRPGCLKYNIWCKRTPVPLDIRTTRTVLKQGEKMIKPNNSLSSFEKSCCIGQKENLVCLWVFFKKKKESDAGLTFLIWRVFQFFFTNNAQILIPLPDKSPASKIRLKMCPVSGPF